MSSFFEPFYNRTRSLRSTMATSDSSADSIVSPYQLRRVSAFFPISPYALADDFQVQLDLSHGRGSFESPIRLDTTVEETVDTTCDGDDEDEEESVEERLVDHRDSLFHLVDSIALAQDMLRTKSDQTLRKKYHIGRELDSIVHDLKVLAHHVSDTLDDYMGEDSLEDLQDLHGKDIYWPDADSI